MPSPAPFPKFLLLDAAGTILHPDPPVGEVYAREARRLGAAAPAAELQAAFRAAYREAAVAGNSGGAGPDSERAFWFEVVADVQRRVPSVAPLSTERWLDALWDAFADPAAWRLFPDVLPCLRAARAGGIRAAVVSNFDRRLPAILEGLGLRGFLSAVVFSGEAGARKPDPRIFRVSLDRLGAKPEEAVHVGDSEEEDGQGARAAGIQAIRIDRDPQACPSPGAIRSLLEIQGRMAKWARMRQETAGFHEYPPPIA